MRQTDPRSKSPRALSRVLVLLIPAWIAGCTPEDQQAIVEAGLSAIVQTVVQFVDFAASFARSAVAAYLF